MGCAKQTDLSTESLPTNVTVNGYVMYLPVGESLTTVSKGHKVDVLYKLTGEDDYAIKTVTTDSYAFFTITLGCPPGKSLDVKVESSFIGDSQASAAGSSSKEDCTSYFFASMEKVIPSGSAYCFNLKMVPVANYGIEDLKQPGI